MQTQPSYPGMKAASSTTPPGAFTRRRLLPARPPVSKQRQKIIDIDLAVFGEIGIAARRAGRPTGSPRTEKCKQIFYANCPGHIQITRTCQLLADVRLIIAISVFAGRTGSGPCSVGNALAVDFGQIRKAPAVTQTTRARRLGAAHAVALDIGALEFTAGRRAFISKNAVNTCAVTQTTRTGGIAVKRIAFSVRAAP